MTNGTPGGRLDAVCKGTDMTHVGGGRRDFLKGLAMIGAVGALPAFAKDDPSVYRGRHRTARMDLAFARVEIGLAKPFSVLHISDTHLTEAYDDEGADAIAFMKERRETFGGRQIEALEDSLAWAKEHVDYIVHTGDLIDWKSRANLDLAKKYFGEAFAMTGCMGNHEFQRTAFWKDCRDTQDYNALSRAELAKHYPFDLELQSTVIGGVNFVALEQVYGLVTERQVGRFRREVAKGLPVVLMMHAPIYTEGVRLLLTRYWNEAAKKDDFSLPPAAGDVLNELNDPVTKEFIRYLKGEKALKAILAGHLHFDYQEQFSPTARQFIVGANYTPHGEEIMFF